MGVCVCERERERERERRRFENRKDTGVDVEPKPNCLPRKGLGLLFLN